MSVYDVDWNNFIVNMLPPDKRNPKHIEWLQAMIGQLADDSSLLFNQYQLGSTDPVYVAGTYAFRAVVIFNGAVYECVNADGTNLGPTTADWRQIAPSFIGAAERIAYRSQKILLEWGLNKWFSTTFRQPPGVSDIFIGNNAFATPVFVVGATEKQCSVVYGDRSSEFVINAYSFEEQFNFTIYVPDTVYYGLGDAANEIVRNFADKYVAAGITYNVIPYKMIFSKKVTLTSAQILALNTTPITLIPAQGIGTTIQLLSYVARLNYGTTAYATNTTLVLEVGNIDVHNDGVILPKTADTLEQVGISGAPFENGATSVNAPLQATVSGGNPTAGDSILDLYLNYIVITL